MPYRIIETSDKLFYPQFKNGFFSSWKFLTKGAATYPFLLERTMLTEDFLEAASFTQKEDCLAFIKAVESRVYHRNAEDFAKIVRQTQDVSIVNKINL